MNVRKGLASLVLGALLLVPTGFAASGDLSLDGNRVSFSSDYILENNSVRIWASIANNSPNDLLGSVRFVANGQNINSDQPISALAGNSDDVFVDWVPTYDGEYTISITVIPWDASSDNPDNNTYSKTIYVYSDLDGDGITDASDDDRDGDGVSNDDDAFPDNAAESSDTDGDGTGNNADDDDDNDGVLDADDAFPENPLYNADQDGDGTPDEEDDDIDGEGLSNEEEAVLGTDPLNTDTDGDGVNDKDDPFPLDAGESQDTDGDGIGDNIDDDRDGDGVSNDDDLAPNNSAPKAVLDEDVILTSIDEPVVFDASDSVDADGDIVEYLWDFGEVQLTGETVEMSFDETGLKEATLTVIDDAGQTDSVDVKVRVLDYRFILFALLFALILISLAFYLIYRYNRRASQVEQVKDKPKKASPTKKKSTKSKPKKSSKSKKK